MLNAPMPAGCHFKFCIFNFNNDCYCRRISHDELGTCLSRIIVQVNDDSLYNLKSQQYTRYCMETYGEYAYIPTQNRRNTMREDADEN